MKKRICYFLVFCILTKIIALECWTDNRLLSAQKPYPCDLAFHSRIYFTGKINVTKKELFDGLVANLFENFPKSFYLVPQMTYIEFYTTYVMENNEPVGMALFISISFSDGSYFGQLTVNDVSGPIYFQNYYTFNAARADYDSWCNKINKLE